MTHRDEKSPPISNVEGPYTTREELAGALEISVEALTNRVCTSCTKRTTSAHDRDLHRLGAQLLLGYSNAIAVLGMSDAPDVANLIRDFGDALQYRNSDIAMTPKQGVAPTAIAWLVRDGFYRDQVFLDRQKAQSRAEERSMEGLTSIIPLFELPPTQDVQGYPIEDEALRKWAVWWQGSGPQRGDHIMIMSAYDMGYGSELAYLGDQHHDAAHTIVDAHNATVAKLRAALTVASEGSTDE